MAQYIHSQHFRDPELGEVWLTVRSTSRQFSARWKGNILKLSIPPGTTISQYEKIMAKWRSELLAKKPAGQRYHVGQHFVFDTFEVSIEPATAGSTYFSVKNPMPGKYTVFVPENLMSDPGAERVVSEMLCRVSRHQAQLHLLDEARQEAARLGLTPRAWSVSHGHRILGHCNRRGEIALSHVLMFLPRDLRVLIICHELAHLTEMNHSDRFHALLDTYVGGREKTLDRALRKFPWPVLR